MAAKGRAALQSHRSILVRPPGSRMPAVPPAGMHSEKETPSASASDGQLSPFAALLDAAQHQSRFADPRDGAPQHQQGQRGIAGQQAPSRSGLPSSNNWPEAPVEPQSRKRQSPTPPTHSLGGARSLPSSRPGSPPKLSAPSLVGPPTAASRRCKSLLSSARAAIREAQALAGADFTDA